MCWNKTDIEKWLKVYQKTSMAHLFPQLNIYMLDGEFCIPSLKLYSFITSFDNTIEKDWRNHTYKFKLNRDTHQSLAKKFESQIFS